MTDEPGIRRAFAGFSTYRVLPEEALALVERARTRCPVPHSDELGGFHILMNYKDVRAALLDWRGFACAPSSLRPYVEGSPRIPPSSFDPPEHGRWRRIFLDGLGQATLDRIAPLVRTDVARRIAEMLPRGECDLVADLAEPVPMLAIFHVLGLDDGMHEPVRDLTGRMFASAGDVERFKASYAEFCAFGFAQVEQRRRDPRDDYLTLLAQAEWDGRLLDEEQVGAAVVGLLGGGHHTTVIAITSLLYEVLRDPAVKARLRADPALVPVAVEEALRLHHPLFGLYRTAADDMEVEGSRIRKGESLYLNWHSANRDPAVFPEPDSFRLDRGDTAHLTFGLGRHSCVGAAMARMEMRCVLETLLARVPEIELVAPEAVRFAFVGGESLAIPALPARFGKRDPA